MKVFSKVINDKTKQLDCIVCGDTSVLEDYSELEREIGYNGSWYLQGYAPEKPQEVKENEVRAVRNSYLQATDIYMLIDFPISAKEREEYKAYRQYLRDYTTQENWWEEELMDFNTWKQGREVLLAEE